MNTQDSSERHTFVLATSRRPEDYCVFLYGTTECGRPRDAAVHQSERFECDKCGKRVERARVSEVDVCTPCRTELDAHYKAKSEPAVTRLVVECGGGVDSDDLLDDVAGDCDVQQIGIGQECMTTQNNWRGKTSREVWNQAVTHCAKVIRGRISQGGSEK